MNRRLLMTPELLAAKRAEMLTDIAPDGRWRTLKRIADSSAMTETSREWLLTLSAMGLLTDDPKYAARAEVLLASAVATGSALIAADRGKPVGSEVFQLAIAYDWLGDRLSPDMLSRVGATLKAWGNWIWPETNFARAGAWGIDAPWDNYYWEFLRGSWLSGLAIGDDALIALSRQKWERGLAWLKEHQPGGFFCEGTNYGIGSLVSILEAVLANATVTGESPSLWLDSAMAMMDQLTSPGLGAKAPFGDQASDYKAVHSDTDRLAALLMGSLNGKASVSKWWLDHISRNRSKRAQSLWADFLYYPSGGLDLFDYRPASFRRDAGAGYISSRGAGKDAVQLQAVCGPTFSSHQDAAGTFTLCRGNDWLIGHAKQYSASGLQHGAEYTNCITVDGRGQDNMLDKTARVLKSEDNERYTLWQCEAGQAHDFSVTSSNRIKPLKSWRRTLVFLKPGTLIVHDRVEKRDAKTVVGLHLNTHTMPVVTALGLGLIEGSSSLYVSQIKPHGIPALKGLLLGSGTALSSYQTTFLPPLGQAVDEFLMVYQAGANGFGPLLVASTDLGVEVGDDEFAFLPDGTVQQVDHRVSPKMKALLDVWNTASTWELAGAPETDPTAQALIAAAKRLIAITE